MAIVSRPYRGCVIRQIHHLNLLVPVSNLPGRRRLRSSFTQQLLVPPYRLSTVGRRSFSVAAFTFWNTLPDDI